MRFTDIFLRRPVLAIVVNLRDHHRRPAGDPLAQRAPVPEARERDGHGPHRLRRRQRRSGARLHHHAARARDRRRRRHRLHRVAERPGAVDDQRPPQAQLQRRERAGRHQRARRTRCAPTCRPRPRCPRSSIEPSDAAVRGDVPELRLRRSCEDNQVTDYLIRVVQPRLSAIDGVQRADILGGAHVRAARLAEARAHGGAQRQPVAGAPGAGRQQLPVRGRSDQGRARPAEPDRDDRSAIGRRVQEAGASASRTARWCAWRTSPTSCWAPTNYDQDVRFSGEQGRVHGRLGAAQRQLARRDRARQRRDRRRSSASCRRA